MAITGHTGVVGADVAPAITSDTDQALANKLRELEKKVAHLDANASGSDDIDTETTFQELER